MVKRKVLKTFRSCKKRYVGSSPTSSSNIKIMSKNKKKKDPSKTKEIAPAGRYRKPRGSTLIPLGYSRDNIRLYYKFRRYSKYIIEGYFDFISEIFYITKKSKGLRADDIVIFKRELDKLGYECLINFDDTLYDKWQEEHKVFNHIKLNGIIAQLGEQ